MSYIEDDQYGKSPNSLLTSMPSPIIQEAV